MASSVGVQLAVPICCFSASRFSPSLDRLSSFVAPILILDRTILDPNIQPAAVVDVYFYCLVPPPGGPRSRASFVDPIAREPAIGHWLRLLSVSLPFPSISFTLFHV